MKSMEYCQDIGNGKSYDTFLEFCRESLYNLFLTILMLSTNITGSAKDSV